MFENYIYTKTILLWQLMEYLIFKHP